MERGMNLTLDPVCNAPTNALVCIKTLIKMSHTKTFKITLTSLYVPTNAPSLL
jgi:hypothetical protein